MHTEQAPVCVAAFYHFADLPGFAGLRAPLLERMLSEGVKGAILLAREGVNGTISGPDAGVANVLDWLNANPQLADLTARYSRASEQPFYRSKVKLKKEIVTMGRADLAFCPGVYVPPKEWNALIQRDDVLLLDTRNDYEYAIGAFVGAVNPKLDIFREFPDHLATTRELMAKRGADKLAMYCTGGIRCEKASSLARALGMDVYHLQGGILAYLEQIPEEESLWRGECFVFDNRVALGHGLRQGSYDQCHACRHPVSAEDKQDSRYIRGESCPHCFGARNQAQQRRAAERVRQIRLARERGEAHVAANLAQARQRKAAMKKRRIQQAAKGAAA